VPRPAAFLDRDGTIIVDRDYPGDPEGVALLPGAAGAIRRLNGAGVPVIVVTNQSGIGRGLITESQFEAVQRRMEALLAEHGARLDGSYHCPHAPDHAPACDCRKPLPGLYRRAAAEHDLDLERSVFVGDRSRDLVYGLEIGARAFLIGGTERAPAPPGAHPVASLAEAVDRELGPGA
jgi:histidinol-phosphate phosphatase family protein